MLPNSGALALCLLTGCTAARGVAFSELSYPMAVSTLDLDGVQIAYSDSGGDGESLLLIHGLGSYMPVWGKNVGALSRGHRVVSIDLPGYGKSSKAAHPYSMAFFADVVDRLIDRLRLRSVVIVGHSMGGQIAMTHALRHPGQAKALVLVAPAGLETFTAAEGELIRRAMSKEIIVATPPEGVRKNLTNNFAQMPRDATFMIEDRLRVMGGPDFEAYATAVSQSVSAMLAGPVYEHLPAIALPALVLFGSEDALIPNRFLHRGSTEALAREGTRRLPKGRLEIIHHAGHMVQFERPEAVNQAILAFLATLPGRQEN